MKSMKNAIKLKIKNDKVFNKKELKYIKENLVPRYDGKCPTCNTNLLISLNISLDLFK